MWRLRFGKSGRNSEVFSTFSEELFKNTLDASDVYLVQTRTLLNSLQLLFQPDSKKTRFLTQQLDSIFFHFFSGQIIAAPRSADEPNFLEAQLLLKTFLFQWSCMVSQLVNLQVAFFLTSGVCSDFFFLPCLICNWTLPGDGPRRCCPQLCVRAAVTALNTETPHDTLLFLFVCLFHQSATRQVILRERIQRPTVTPKNPKLHYYLHFRIWFDGGGNTLNQPPHEFLKLFFWRSDSVFALHPALGWWAVS